LFRRNKNKPKRICGGALIPAIMRGERSPEDQRAAKSRDDLPILRDRDMLIFILYRMLRGPILTQVAAFQQSLE